MRSQLTFDVREHLRDRLPSALEDVTFGSVVEYEIRAQDTWGESRERWTIQRGNRTIIIEVKEKREVRR